MDKERAGILMPITSLPSEYGIGCFSKSAYDFVDWLKEAGQSYWQILPLGPTSYGDSPVPVLFHFCGKSVLYQPEGSGGRGVLTKEECEKVNWGKRADSVDYEKIYKGRYKLLRKAYENSNISENPDYQRFVAENNWWLSDYALFMAVKGSVWRCGVDQMGRRISVSAGQMLWTITAENYILTLNSSSICSLNSMNSG